MVAHPIRAAIKGSKKSKEEFSVICGKFLGNENEIKELTDKKNLLDSINQLKQFNKLIIITRSENGSLAINNNEVTECKSIKINKLLDLTGAGDLFAAGFLKEYLDKSDIKKCLTVGSIAASKIIQKIGARLN